MEKEIKSLRDNDVWDLVELPEGQTAVGSKWVFKTKTDADGRVERHKARLVAQGYLQKFGTDYDETFCPVVRLESVRALIAMSVQRGLQLHQVDITTAFLNGKLDKDVYMKQPEGFTVTEKRSIYGLKQSPRCWNDVLDSHLKEMSFIQTTADPCIYRSTGGENAYLGVYVDDIVIAAKSNKQMKEIKNKLAERFDIKDLGKLRNFLGMKIVQKPDGLVWIGQPGYTEKLLESFGMDQAKVIATPVETNNKLVKASDDEEMYDQQKYQSAVGSLLYLSVTADSHRIP